MRKIIKKILRIILAILFVFTLITPISAQEIEEPTEEPTSQEEYPIMPLISDWNNYLVWFDQSGKEVGRTTNQNFPFYESMRLAKEIHFNYNLEKGFKGNFTLEMSFKALQNSSWYRPDAVTIYFYTNNHLIKSIGVPISEIILDRDRQIFAIKKEIEMTDTFDYVSVFMTYNVPRATLDFTVLNMVVSSNDDTSGLLGNIIEIIKGIPSAIANAFKSMIDWVVSEMNRLADNIVKSLSIVLDGFKHLMEELINNLTNAVNMIQIWLINLGNFIIDGLKSLFIPDTLYYEDWYEDIESAITEKLGFILYPFTFLSDLLNRYIKIGQGTGVIHIPNIPIMGVNIIEENSIDLTLAFTQILGHNYGLYYAFVDVTIFCLFLNLIIKKFNSIFGGGK